MKSVTDSSKFHLSLQNLELLISLASSVQESMYLDRLFCFIFISHPSPQVAHLRHHVELYISRGEYIAARDALLDMIQLDPDYLEPYYMLSTFSSEYGVTTSHPIDENDSSSSNNGVVSPSQRKEYANRVLDSLPRHYGAMIALGRAYRELGKQQVNLSIHVFLKVFRKTLSLLSDLH